MNQPDSASFKSGEITLTDGVRLRYLEAGSGPPLLMVPGWSQAAIQFKHQLAGLSDRYRVIAVDPRGHGESDKPDHGYRLSRLAADLREALDTLALEDATLLGHSLGAATIWCFWAMFGAHRSSRFIFVDQPPFLVEQAYASEPSWAGAAASLPLDTLQQIVRDLCGANGEATTRTMLAGMVSPQMTAAEFDWLVEMNLRMPRRYAARLLYYGAMSDWRDTIPRIDVPTLVVSGRGSHVPWQSQAWIHERIAGSQIAFVEENERGRHFMYMENPAKFNALVRTYLG